MQEIDKIYDSRKVEDKWLNLWLERRVFHSEVERGGEPYCIVIPPPNVTGILHMGHAFNVTIQDILMRWRRMQGRNAIWIPGTDHAGIATQNVVERSLAKEGKTRRDLGREAFVERVWQWKKQYGDTIIRQLKRIGASCDWDRERFTMDEGLSEAVEEMFIRLYERKLIYRGNYIINWCCRCHTALSDEESEHVETEGALYFIRYPRKGGKKKDAVVVATTRPETLLGDVAIAVNPRDARYASLEGARFILPLLNREIGVVKDDFVDQEFGTGAVKVTPAHDPNDFEMGLRHGLEPVNVMNGDGTMNENAGPYKGLDRFECRKRVLEDLAKAGLIEDTRKHVHSVGHCYRCNSVVEPRLSLQWFVKMKPLARPALEAVRQGHIQFMPDRWTKVYLDWMENIRDWCISRQIWWGHRIPVFYCDACGNEWAVKGRPPVCPACGSAKIRQDEDVLDTWFSSWLWPFSTLGWPHGSKDLSFYYPTDTLVTASEIIFFWVARMIMAGLDVMGEVPFRRVYIHGTVRDDTGRKMSKSLGNSIDPLAVVNDFSADALRFSLMMVTAVGQDVYLSNDKFEIGRNFLTKIWNAARFIMMNSKDFTPPPVQDAEGGVHHGVIGCPAFDPQLLGPDDKHILSRLNATVVACSENLERCRFNDAAKALYDFVWHQFCDWHIEYAKITLAGADAPRREQVLMVLHHVFSSILRMLHPMVPFITEELWHSMGYGAGDESIAFAPWPAPAGDDVLASGWGATDSISSYVENKHELIRIGRTLKSDYGIEASMKVKFIIKPEDEAAAELLRSDRNSIAVLLKAESVDIDPVFAPQKALPSGANKMGAIFMPMAGVVDIEAEKKRLADQLGKAANDLAAVNRKLGNIDFVEKAPKHVVELQATRKKDLLAKCEKLKRLLAVLTGKDAAPDPGKAGQPAGFK